MTTKSFDAAVLKDDILGEVVELSYSNENPDQNISVRISPKYGSNLYQIKYGRYELMYCDKQALAEKHDFTGCFVLWPFPNRVAGRKYSFNGKNFLLTDVIIPKGNEVLVHGLVRDREWIFSTPQIRENNVSVTTSVQINERSPYFENFPFPSILSLTYTLSINGVTISYKVENKGKEKLPFGFALHPAFSTLLSGINDTYISLASNIVEETNNDLLPTERKLDVNTVMYKQFNLQKPKPVSSLELDHIYSDSPSGESFVVDHTKQKIRVKLTHSDEFRYNIIFTMEGDTFICLEPQTCITNAINLDYKKYNLLSVDQGEIYSGYIAYSVEKY